MSARVGAVALALALAGCRPTPAPDEFEIEAVLDALHRHASEADEEAYFALFAPEGVFLGTDGSERWSVAEFREYAHPHFAAGRGWTYTVRERNVRISPGGDVAWFDEVLDNASYGECRGTGVLRLFDDAGWKIEQYNLTIPIPNDLAGEFVERIRQGGDPAD